MYSVTYDCYGNPIFFIVLNFTIIFLTKQEAENAAKGLETKPDSQYYDPDDSWWDDPEKLFDGMDTDKRVSRMEQRS